MLFGASCKQKCGRQLLLPAQPGRYFLVASNSEQLSDPPFSRQVEKQPLAELSCTVGRRNESPQRKLEAVKPSQRHKEKVSKYACLEDCSLAIGSGGVIELAPVLTLNT